VKEQPGYRRQVSPFLLRAWLIGAGAIARSAHRPAYAYWGTQVGPFWIHGTEGTIRGGVLLGGDFLGLDRGEPRESALQPADLQRRAVNR
jgi:hypothetical protein